jgi:hypothetical protein
MKLIFNNWHILLICLSIVSCNKFKNGAVLREKQYQLEKDLGVKRGSVSLTITQDDVDEALYILLSDSLNFLNQEKPLPNFLYSKDYGGGTLICNDSTQKLDHAILEVFKKTKNKETLMRILRSDENLFSEKRFIHRLNARN